MVGKDEAAKAFASLQRDYFINKKTTLAVQQNPKTPESEAVAKKIEDAFAKL